MEQQEAGKIEAVTAAGARGSASWWLAALQWALLAVVAVRAGFFLVYSARTILFPFPVDYDEGVILHSALLLARGEAVYRPPAAGEFVSSAYTPLFFALAAPFLKLAGATLVPGRLIALLASLGSCVLLGVLGRRLGLPWRGALTVGLLPLSMGTMLVWSTLAKPDTLALFLIVLTLYWVVRFEDSRWAYLAALWFALGFFAKQNTVVCTGPALLYLFLRRPRQGLAVGLLAAALAAGPFFLLDALTGGAFLLHTFGFHRLPWDLAHWWSTAEPLLVFTPGLALLALAGAWRAARQRALRPALVLLGGGLLFLLTGGRVGTNWSFQLPLLLGMALATGLALFPPTPPAGRPAGRLLLLGLAIAQMALIPNPLRWYRTDLLASPARREELAAACTILRQTPPPLLSEDVGMLLLCGHEPRYDDPFMMAQLARAGRWDDGELTQEIAREEFPLVVLAYDLEEFAAGRTELLRWTPGPMAALRAHYVLWQELGGLYLYRPRGGGR